MCIQLKKFVLFFPSDKDVLRTDRDVDSYKQRDSVKLIQLENLLRTYAMYNFDLGKLLWVSYTWYMDLRVGEPLYMDLRVEADDY